MLQIEVDKKDKIKAIKISGTAKDVICDLVASSVAVFETIARELDTDIDSVYQMYKGTIESLLSQKKGE